MGVATPDYEKVQTVYNSITVIINSIAHRIIDNSDNERAAGALGYLLSILKIFLMKESTRSPYNQYIAEQSSASTLEIWNWSPHGQG